MFLHAYSTFMTSRQDNMEFMIRLTETSVIAQCMFEVFLVRFYLQVRNPHFIVVVVVVVGSGSADW